MAQTFPLSTTQPLESQTPCAQPHWRRLLAMLGPQRWRIVAALIGLIVSSAVGLAFPLLIGQEIGQVLALHDYARLDAFALLLLGLFVVMAVGSFVQTYFLGAIGERIVYDLRTRLYQRLTTLSLDFFARHRTGELVSRLSSDVTLVRALVTTNLSTLFSQAIGLIGSVVIIFALNPTLTLFLLALLPIILVVAIGLGRPLERMSTRVQDDLARATVTAEEGLSGIRVVKSFAREGYEYNRFASDLAANLRSALRITTLRAGFSSVLMLLGFGSLAAIVWFAGRQVIAGTMTLPLLTSFLIYGIQIATDDLPTIQLPDNYARERLPFLARMAREHGPVFKHDWPDGGRVVYMVGPEANKFVMQTQREHFSHDLGWTPDIGEIMGKGLLNMDPPEHDRHRKMMNPAFTMTYMTRYLPIMNRVIAERTREWAERAEVDLHEEARKITFDVAAETLVGFKAGPQVDYLRDMFYALLHAGADVPITSEAEWLAQVLPVRDRLQGTLRQLIAERRGIPEDNRSDILAMLVNARDENGAALSDEQLLAHVNILLVAGHETSTTLGAWLLYLLATHPEELARVREEFDSVLGADGDVTMDAIKATRQLGYAVQEAGRMYPPVAMVPRGVLSDVEFGGYLLPAGTYINLVIGANHWDSSLFPEPGRFDPQRFAPPREEDKRAPYALATFGGGPRICIGVNFAQVEVKAMALHILRHYDLEPVAPDEVVQEYPGPLGGPPHGIRVRVRERNE